MQEQFQNCQFLEPNFNFPNWTKSRNLIIVQFGRFQKISILKNPENLQFGEIRKFAIWKIPKIGNWEKSENLQFEEIRTISNLEISKNFPNFIISKIIKFFILFNIEK